MRRTPLDRLRDDRNVVRPLFRVSQWREKQMYVIRHNDGGIEPNSLQVLV
jgi:hypothetical protein